MAKAPIKKVSEASAKSAKAMMDERKRTKEGGDKPRSAEKAREERSDETPSAELQRLSPRPNWIPDISQPTGMYDGILLVERPKPFPEKTPYSLQELQRLREALIEEKRRLQDELASLAGASREALDLTREHPGYSVHMAEHATDLQTAEANMGVRTIEEQRLAQVEAALERIEKRINRYGLCLACGNKIGIQRLIAQPHAHLCMDCRTRYEKVKSRRGF